MWLRFVVLVLVFLNFLNKKQKLRKKIVDCTLLNCVLDKFKFLCVNVMKQYFIWDFIYIILIEIQAKFLVSYEMFVTATAAIADDGGVVICEHVKRKYGYFVNGYICKCDQVIVCISVCLKPIFDTLLFHFIFRYVFIQVIFVYYIKF